MDEEVIVYTVEEYLINKVRFDVPTAALTAILVDRGLDATTALDEVEDRDNVRLAYADMIKWFLLGASKVNNVTDSDNGWSHAGGGFELSDEDREDLKVEANAIYSELEPASTFGKKVSFRMTSHGVKIANRTMCGEYMPRIHKL